MSDERDSFNAAFAAMVVLAATLGAVILGRPHGGAGMWAGWVFGVALIGSGFLIAAGAAGVCIVGVGRALGVGRGRRSTGSAG